MRLHCIVSTEFGTNLEDDEEQEIFDDPLAVQTEVIELSSQKSPVWESIDVTPIRFTALNFIISVQYKTNIYTVLYCADYISYP